MRVPFDKQYAPKDWPYDKLGEPDVVLMVKDTGNKLGLPDVGAKGYKAVEDQIPVERDYDKAHKLQADAVVKVAKTSPVVSISNHPAEEEGKGWTQHYVTEKATHRVQGRMFLSPEGKDTTAVRLIDVTEQGKGFGTVLLDHAIKVAKDRGSKTLISDPEGGIKPAAARLFEKVGAKKIPYKGAVDDYVYELDLSKKITHKFYREDQARDDHGQFADEGGGEVNTSDMTPAEKAWMDEFQREQKAFVKETGQKGLRHDAVLTGDRLPANTLTDYLDTVGDMQVQNLVTRGAQDKMKYGGPQDFIRSEGHEFEVPDKPPQIKLMTPKECYSNATKMMLRDPTKYDYVEGYYASPHLPWPVEHAWLVDKSTHTVVDPTLGWQPKARYAGVVYPKMFVIKKMQQNKYYGIHSNGNTVSDVVLGLDKDFHYANAK